MGGGGDPSKLLPAFVSELTSRTSPSLPSCLTAPCCRLFVPGDYSYGQVTTSVTALYARLQSARVRPSSLIVCSHGLPVSARPRWQPPIDPVTQPYSTGHRAMTIRLQWLLALAIQAAVPLGCFWLDCRAAAAQACVCNVALGHRTHGFRARVPPHATPQRSHRSALAPARSNRFSVARTHQQWPGRYRPAD